MINKIKSILNRFLIFVLAIALLFYLKANQFSIFSPEITNSLQLTERKILFISLVLFFITFRITYRIPVFFGLMILFLVALLALFDRMGAVNRLVVYAWGFLLLAGLMQIPELLRKK